MAIIVYRSPTDFDYLHLMNREIMAFTLKIKNGKFKILLNIVFHGYRRRVKMVLNKILFYFILFSAYF